MSGNYFIRREFCPACRSTESRELYSKGFVEPPISDYLEDFYSPQGGVEFDYLNGARYILDECAHCSLVYQRLIPDDRLMVKLYEEWIDPEIIFNMEVKNQDINHYERLASEVRMIIRHFRLQPSHLRFLDFGMGWGEWCRMAQAYGCSVFGTELSQTRMAYAKTFGISVLGWKEVSERQFDFINTEQVFEHLPDPLATFQYLCNSLKPDGIIKISVPNGWDIKRRLAIMDWTASKGTKNSLNPVAPLEHINCFTHSAIAKMAEINGYVPVKVRVHLPLNRSVLNFTVREVVRPYFDRLRALKPDAKKPTYLFFQRRKESVAA